jgi:NitT/TauT family transport system permease protein
MLFGFGSFLIPILLWCAVSYFPFIWHPQVKITDSGSVTYLQVDSRIAKDIFYTEAQSALDQGNTRHKVFLLILSICQHRMKLLLH